MSKKDTEQNSCSSVQQLFVTQKRDNRNGAEQHTMYAIFFLQLAVLCTVGGN